ncbi:MAG: aryl-sulfate sulfotransferase, partial [Candidatus Hodarchaeota archaeon]
FLLFDNDHHNQTDINNENSRLIEIVVNEDTMVANESWTYAAPPDYWSVFMGDADPLPNGHRFGAFGYINPPTGEASSRFIEINEQGEIVGQTLFYYDDDYLYGAYRVELFKKEPIIKSIPNIQIAQPATTLKWDVFYNYRTKGKVPGEFWFYIDGAEITSGTFDYEKFWRPTTLSLNTGILDIGQHNATLMISDGFGNTQTDSVNVTYIDFFIDRTGSSLVERGQQTSLPTWSGKTSDPLAYNITSNGTLVVSSVWTGSDIVLDPDTLVDGAHEIEFRLFNATDELYDDSFWFYITPAEPPVILPLQSTEISVNWSDPLELSWNITDVTGQSWSIFVNGSFIQGATWDPPSTIVNWNIPEYRDGIYNITLVAQDALGHKSVSLCWLTILPPLTPHIISSPGSSSIEWGDTDVSLIWEVFGGTNWELEKNGVIIRTGIITSDFIEIEDLEWLEEDWRPGVYYVTLTVYLGEASTQDSITVTVVLDLGDPYADDFVPTRSLGFTYGENAIGAPDGLYTIIYVDYSNGYITLDMGEDERIVDGPGFDFSVIALGDNYSVFVSNSLDASFELLGRGIGNESFDLMPSGLSQVRYVRVEIFSGDIVQLDAIVAFNFNLPEGDNDSPEIEPISNFSIFVNDSSTTLTWTASDETPWSYEISINSTVVESGWWDGSSIVYIFEPESIGHWNITILLTDAFGNSASDTVIINVISPTSPPTSSDGNGILVIAGLGMGVIAVLVFITWRYSKRT